MSTEDTTTRARSLLATSATLWHDIVNGIPADLVERPAAAGEWSAADCLRHLLGSDGLIFPHVVRQLLDGREELTLPDTADRPPASERSLPELIEAFGRVHGEVDSLLAGLEPGDLARAAPLPPFGQITLAEVLNAWTAHHLVHGAQAQRALLQGVLPGTGPLRTVSAEHDLEAQRG